MAQAETGNQTLPHPSLLTPGPHLHAPASTSRLALFDAVRFLAALAVIWFHTADSDALKCSGVLGRFSVAFYTIMGILFLVEGIRRRPGRTFTQYAALRFRRLYLPFLGWSALTAAALLIAHRFDPDTPVAPLQLDVLITGTDIALWFIPFMLLGCLLLFFPARWAIGSLRREILLALACAALALTLDLLPWNDPPFQSVPFLGKLFIISWHRWSRLYWGVFLAVIYARFLKNAPLIWLTAALGLAAAALAVALALYIFHVSHDVLPSVKVAGGLGFSLAALAPARGRIIAYLARFAPFSFGIYLSHMLFISVLHAGTRLCDIPNCWQRDLFIFLAATAACITTIHALGRHPSLEWLAGNEVPDRRPRVQPAVGT